MILRNTYKNFIVVGEPDNSGWCEVRIRVDDSSDLLSLFHAGCNVGVDVISQSEVFS